MLEILATPQLINVRSNVHVPATVKDLEPEPFDVYNRKFGEEALTTRDLQIHLDLKRCYSETKLER